MPVQFSFPESGWPFSDGGGIQLETALTSFLHAREAPPRLLGLGEPLHGEEEFLRLRNQLFRYLAEREGYRSVAIESDCLSALMVDAFAAGAEMPWETVMDAGFSHGWGKSPANRELVAWIKEHNEDRDPVDQIRFHGFDAPLEYSGAASPRRALRALYDYLAAQVEPLPPQGGWNTIDRLIGADERWTNPAAMMDPTQSVGASAEVGALRLIVDELMGVLKSQSPHLLATTSRQEWERTSLHGRTATGLLRYHAAMADTSDARMARLMSQRDAMMADNLHSIAAVEAPRGPTLVFAHNRHLQKHQSRVEGTWQGTEWSLRWWSAGAIVSAQLGPQYAFLALALGSATDHGLGVPAPDTLEGVLYASTDDRCFTTGQSLTGEVERTGVVPTLRTGASHHHGYFPLEPDQLGSTDGVIFLRDVPSSTEGHQGRDGEECGG
ncbi:erythromycin esterase family protein [Streptomyces albipurpureus]|uniref:Erythromycin esterase family protein n=1 Tax=Streptomyces albipurpureus TaxID=2897419 RepID=A0ABT0UYC6_9ACTN|nr:erythromycin esterase family protein [Streptomyces sp. CWNU-1]MCM2392156.1 erythromycin esterase family protein [Streptomyces sp. CWNU-1]